VNRVEIGRWGEGQAEAEYLRRGFRVVARNFRVRPYEMDLILENGVYLVFCEVKTRRSNQYGLPGEAVTLTKQRHLLNVASFYLSQHPTSLQPRMDVCEVWYSGRNEPVLRRIHIIENAFGE
jgi:putative endonuclease